MRLQRALGQLAKDLTRLDAKWAVIGGLAVSARAEPRATRDIDVAVAVDGDHQAEQIVSTLTAMGYAIEAVLEHKITGRMATVRLRAPGESALGVLVDLFFASSGVEPEIVRDAGILELWPEMSLRVAAIGHLLALKVLAARPKDLEDIQWLLKHASPEDLESAYESLTLIMERGFDRDKDLLQIFETARSQHSGTGFFVERDLGGRETGGA